MSEQARYVPQATNTSTDRANKYMHARQTNIFTFYNTVNILQKRKKKAEGSLSTVTLWYAVCWGQRGQIHFESDWWVRCLFRNIAMVKYIGITPSGGGLLSVHTSIPSPPAPCSGVKVDRGVGVRMVVWDVWGLRCARECGRRRCLLVRFCDPVTVQSTRTSRGTSRYFVAAPTWVGLESLYEAFWLNMQSSEHNYSCSDA